MEENPSQRVENEYTARDIQVLKGLEAVRRRPGMYIGSTDQRGLHHLVLEIVYNSIDEAIAGYCSQVSLTLCKDDKVRVEDNGRGIDWRQVKERARKLGLIDPGLDPSEEESLNLLFLPGFSTREEVTELSGRGVGLDVVKRNITRISGMIEVRSEPGLGTRFQITLPLTLAIIRVLLVEIFGRIYGIPLTSIQENLAIQSSEIRTVEGREVIQLRERTLPLLRLEHIFQLSPREAASGNGRGLYVVVVGLAERKIGIVVEDLVGQQDVVIKPLGKLTEIVPGVAGAADLGSQRTILILDVGRLIEEATRMGGSATAA